MNDDRNDTEYSCVTVSSTVSQPSVADIIDESDPTRLYVAGEYQYTLHVSGCMCMFKLTVTGWWIIVTFLAGLSYIVSQLASYLFSYFLLQSLLPFQIQNFCLYVSCIIYHQLLLCK